jgi:ubiquinone/menaquinone biosynthesis C-methylase UbiE
VVVADHLDEIRRQFTRQADAYADMPQTKDDAPHEALVRFAGVRAGDRVLDVACGPGFLTMAFARRAAAVVGVDATQALLERARAEATRRGLGNVRFETGDATALPLPDAAFDVVSCRAAFHHFPHPERVTAEMRRVARPGARLLVADMVGTDDAEKAAYHDGIERLCDPTHVRALPVSEFERLFASAGLEILAAGERTSDYEVESWMAHGGPSPDVAAEIRRRFEASLSVDRCGLSVRRKDGRLWFSHRVVAFLLARPEA